MVEWESQAYTVGEGDGFVMVCLVQTNGAQIVSSLLLNYIITPGEALGTVLQ